MTWSWQDVATVSVVATAIAYLARKLVPGLSRAQAVGCAHCPVKKGPGGSGSCRDAPVVVSLGPIPKKGKTGPAA